LRHTDPLVEVFEWPPSVSEMGWSDPYAYGPDWAFPIGGEPGQRVREVSLCGNAIGVPAISSGLATSTTWFVTDGVTPDFSAPTCVTGSHLLSLG